MFRATDRAPDGSPTEELFVPRNGRTSGKRKGHVKQKFAEKPQLAPQSDVMSRASPAVGRHFHSSLHGRQELQTARLLKQTRVVPAREKTSKSQVPSARGAPCLQSNGPPTVSDAQGSRVTPPCWGRCPNKKRPANRNTTNANPATCIFALQRRVP